MVPASKRQQRIEWTLITVFVLLCGLLTALQYEWTGALARAEAEKISRGIRTQMQRLTQNFDTELAQAIQSLVPSSAELTQKGLAAAHQTLWQQWQAQQPRPMFARIAIVQVVHQTLKYHELNLKTGIPQSAEWPREWQSLRTLLQNKLTGHAAPFFDPWGLVFEVPIFAKGRETEWVIFELDEIYLREHWLPTLVNKHLGIDQVLPGIVSVLPKDDPSHLIYSSENTSSAPITTSIDFNLLGKKSDQDAFGPSRPAWKMQFIDVPEKVDSLIRSSRRRNLAIAIGVNVLILGVGVLLVHFTHRSRELASQQMNFVAAVSHELRTPLAVIKGATHNLQRGLVKNPERVAQYLSLILQNTDQLNNMVEQVLAHASTQQAPTTPRVLVNLRDVLNKAIAACEADVLAAQCVMEVTIPHDLPRINGDEAALQRAFQNLISNAAKHASSGHWIGVTAHVIQASLPPRVEIQVADHGAGIPESEHASVFDPFVRGKAATKAQRRGAGLGLSLVREIVKQHDGVISLRSTPGQGSTFTISFPTFS